MSVGNKNQFKVFCSRSGVALKRYSSLIAVKLHNGEVYISDKWDYSATTLKHFKLFLGFTNTGITNTKKEIQKFIDDGIYHLVSEAELESMYYT